MTDPGSLRYCGDWPDGLCPDCGCTPVHEDSPPGYCRRCSEKGGNGYAFRTSVDHDKLRAKLGRELAAEVLSECKDDRA